MQETNINKGNYRENMLFGIPEIKEYEKTCTDPYVLAIIKKLWEAKSNAAKWNDAYNKLETLNKMLENYIKKLEKCKEMLKAITGI